MITCEHCGSPLPEGAIFCGECGRAVSTASARRVAAPTAERPDAPPPLQAPDPHGRPRQDPASEAWLPEATLDPATRAWLTGRDRAATGPVAPIPIVTPDEQTRAGAHPPRSAPTHVHGAGSGVQAWTVGSASRFDDDAVDDPIGDARVRPGTSSPAGDARAEGIAADGSAEPSLDPDAFPNEPTPSYLDDAQGVGIPTRPRSDEPPTAVPPVEPAAPAAPSWWVGRSRSEAAEHPAPDADAEPRRTPDGDAPRRPEPAATSEAPTNPDTPTANDTAVVPPLTGRRASRPAPLVPPGSQATVCHVCGHTLEPDDIFCEECGAVRGAVTAAFTGPVVPLPAERPDWAARDDVASADEVDGDASTDAREHGAAHDPGTSSGSESTSSWEPTPWSEPASRSDPTLRSDMVSEPEAAPGSAAAPGSETPAGAGATAEAPVVPPRPGSATMPSSSPRGEPLPAGAFVPPLPPVPGAVLPGDDPVPTSGDADEAAELDEDVDVTRIVERRPEQAPFILHCSTGERIGVYGSGLLGRLPRPEPGERFDDLLTVRDPGKSVSKTHLELGRDGDDLWVSDRFSGNGTVVRHIDGSIRRCEPGRRYRVERGARVDIGEQFFLVQ